MFAFVLFPLKLSTQTDGECTMCAEGKTRGCLKCNLKYQGHPQGKLDDHWWRSYKIQTQLLRSYKMQSQLSRSYKMQSQLSYRGPLKMETTWSSPIVFVLPLRREGEQIISKIFDLIWFDLIWFGLVWFNLDWFGLIWIDLVGFDLSWIKTWKWNQNAHIIQKFPMLIANLSN